MRMVRSSEQLAVFRVALNEVQPGDIRPPRSSRCCTNARPGPGGTYATERLRLPSMASWAVIGTFIWIECGSRADPGFRIRRERW